MIDVETYIDKLRFLSIYMENKIWCIGREPFPYEFEWWLREVTKKSYRDGVSYWIPLAALIESYTPEMESALDEAKKILNQ